ncbi:MAG TPA: hypothetical protein VIL74_20785 [Pyrinomonadaceae bacterium]|jgi:hypothetical protein
MPRETYPRSDETFKVLSGNEADFAREGDKDGSHFNRIKNGDYQDPYSLFRALFRIGCRTNAPVEIWLNDLTAIYVRSRRLHLPASDLSGKILEKIHSDAEALSEILKALSDKVVTKEECHLVLAKLAANEETNNQIKAAVLHRLGELGDAEEKKLRAV